MPPIVTGLATSKDALCDFLEIKSAEGKDIAAQYDDYREVVKRVPWNDIVKLFEIFRRTERM